MSKVRRKLLQAASLTALGLTGYSLNRGLRLPPLRWDPFLPNDTFAINGVTSASGKNVIQTPTLSTFDACFRAFAPEPQLTLQVDPSKVLSVCIRNIASDAILDFNSNQISVSESREGTNRLLDLRTKTENTAILRWKLPPLGHYQFAAIGDTGGDRELAWCLGRAKNLGARFLLHLGDFNYQEGDYERAIDLFNSSPIPVYVSIGNHDFHTDGAIYGSFLDEIGPLNHAFSIGQTRFANIDTAAATFPASTGQRGELVKTLIQDTNFRDTVIFTHRPLHDPLPDSDHDIGYKRERDWLIKSLKKMGASTLLSGHIHIYDRSEVEGIDNIIAGQGLGHQDLIVNRDYSKMVIGTVSQDGSVSYSPEPLAMPMDIHCHPRTDVVKQSLRDAAHWPELQEVEKACKGEGT